MSFLHVFAIFVCSFLTSVLTSYFRNRVWGPKFDLALLTLKDDQVPVIPKQLGPLKKLYETQPRLTSDVNSFIFFPPTLHLSHA